MAWCRPATKSSWRTRGDRVRVREVHVGAEVPPARQALERAVCLDAEPAPVEHQGQARRSRRCGAAKDRSGSRPDPAGP